MKYRNRQRWGMFFHVLNLVRKIIMGILFWGLLIILIVVILPDAPPRIRKNTLLVLQPHGRLVDTWSSPPLLRNTPLAGFPETLLDDLVSALDLAAKDERIVGLWLKLDNLLPSGAAASGELADAIRRFSLSGKIIVASADDYGTSSYRMASAADSIIVDRLGSVFPAGYGFWRAYFAEALDKLGGEVQVFRSGESKSGADNFLMNQMSEESRRNEEILLGDLWDEWLIQVAQNRSIAKEDLKDWIDHYDRYLLEADGMAAESALKASLVDAVEEGRTLQSYLDDLYGEDVYHIDALDYVAREGRGKRRMDVIAVVPIVGTLVYGEGGPGMSGSQQITEAIVSARSAPGVRALVLRINSPGGDVWAGEAIRRVLEETREEWNLPVVVSFGNLAASGGYWIGMESDLIVTRPESITGSIGVYSLSLNFKKGLEEWLGVRMDGLGTTPWSGSGRLGLDFDERTAEIHRAAVMDIDRMFRNLVGEKRRLSAELVDELAGGIPWSGKRALALGLADREGGLAEARQAAAELAGLQEWRTRYFEAAVNARYSLAGWISGRRRMKRSLGKTLFF